MNSDKIDYEMLLLSNGIRTKEQSEKAKIRQQRLEMWKRIEYQYQRRAWELEKAQLKHWLNKD